MSDVFFKQLGMNKPDVYLDLHDGSSASQVGCTVMAQKELWIAKRPHMVVIFGGVSATPAAAVIANKLILPLTPL